MSGAISLRQAIVNTDMILRAQLPAVATALIDSEALERHYELTGEFLWPDPVTSSMFREVGMLSYVRDFDYTAWGHNFFSSELVRAFDDTLSLYLGVPASEISDLGSLSFFHETPLEQFTLKGVHNSEILDIDAGLIELVAGRRFTEEEIETLAYVAVVSQDFLDANNLYLGSYLLIDYHIYDEEAGANFYYPENDDSLLLSQRFELKIIGVFEKELVIADVEALGERYYFDFINRIYVPNAVVESVVDLYMQVLPEIDPELYVEILAADHVEDVLSYDGVLFLLYDPTDLVAFAYAAKEILPAFWMIEDLSNTYSYISNSMEMMNEIVNQLMVGTLIATLIILGLLILLFLVDRKQEVGIYLALGEKKKNILAQLMMEMMAVAFIGMTVALFVGNTLSTEISRTMIEQDIIRQLEDPERIVGHGLLSGMGFRVEMTHEEMIDMYEVSLDVTTVLLFYGITLVAVLLAAGIPTLMVIQMNPKEVLL